MTADFPLYVQQELVFDKVLPWGAGCSGGGGGYLMPLLHKTNMTITIPVKILYEIWNVDSEFT